MASTAGFVVVEIVLEANCIARGSFGIVYRGKMHGMPVCAKVRWLSHDPRPYTS
jgi:hypothetical protein